ncbi:hypothetical protein Tco_1151448 [Tanacetum coccineum]
MQLRLSCLTSRSIISTGSSTTLSLSSSQISFIGMTRDLSHKYFLEMWKVASRGWSFASAVPGQMTHLVASPTLASANSCVMQGAFCTQRKISMVLFSIPFVLSWGGSISSDSFLPSILLLVVIVVTVVIVLVVVVVAIVGVVIVVVIIGVVVQTFFSCAFRAEEMPSLISCRMAAKVMAGVQMSDVLLGRHSIKQKISHTLRGYGMIHEDGDNDAIGGDDDEREISWK